MRDIQLINKYRPHSWAEVVGQETIVSILSRQVATKTFKNTYLFCGSHGCGKTSVARILANEINDGQGSPIEIDGASNNGVDNIRSLIQDAQQSAIDCDFKVYIIDEAHQLTRQAWDASLKLIEEPPTGAVFVFCTTNPEKIPNTIMSRVQRFDFRKVPQDKICDRLEYICNEELSVEYDKQALARIARLSDGHMRDAIQYLDKCADCGCNITVDLVESLFGLVKSDSIDRYILGQYNKDVVFALKQLDDLSSTNCDYVKVFDELVQSLIEYAIQSKCRKQQSVSVLDSAIEQSFIYSMLKRATELRNYADKATAYNLIRTIAVEMCSRG